LKSIQAILKARNDLETAAVLQSNGTYQAQVANPELINEMTTGQQTPGTSPTAVNSALGPCTALCANVVVTGVTQETTLSANETCTVANNITNNIQQDIKGQISASLKNQQDIIESAFVSNTETIATNISTVMAQNVTNNFVEELTQAMSSFQRTTVTGNSIIVSGIQQSFTGTMVGTLNVTNTVNDQLRQSADYSITQTLLNKNDTIGDLTTDFLGVINTMSQLMEELATQILIIVAAVLAAVVLVIGSLYVFNKNFHSWANHAIGTAADAELAHFQRMRTDPTYRKQVEDAKIQDQSAKLLDKQVSGDIAARQIELQSRLNNEHFQQAVALRQQEQDDEAKVRRDFLNMTPEEQKAEVKRLRANKTLWSSSGGLGAGGGSFAAAAIAGLFH
jgi:hypothetical protein